MFNTRKFFVLLPLVFGLVFCPAVFSFARGGIYVDAVQIKNNGAVVFFDNFDDGSISDWKQPINTSVFDLKNNPVSRMLWMNEHGTQTSTAQHVLNISQIDSLELSAMVYVAPVEEQYQWVNAKVSSFFIDLEYREMPNVAPDAVRISVMLYPYDESCKIAAQRYSQTKQDFHLSSKPLLPTGKWALLTLRLDPKSETAVAYVDNSFATSIHYDPADFPTFNNLSLTSTLGDGSEVE